MFFDLILLKHQHQGSFSQAWLASTRGIRYVPKESIKKIDICFVTDEIVKFITSQSDMPKKRFSLRLSSLLVNGVIRIQNQKAIFLLSDIVNVLSKVKKPLILSDLESLPTPTSINVIFRRVERKRKRPAKVVTKDTAESLIERIVNADKIPLQKIAKAQIDFNDASLLARTDDISIRDSQLRPVTLHDEELGSLGNAILTEKEYNDIMLPIQHKLKTAKDLAAKKPDQRSASSSQSSSSIPPGKVASKKILVEAQVHQSADVEFQHEKIVPQATIYHENIINQVSQVERREVLLEQQDAILSEKSKEIDVFSEKQDAIPKPKKRKKTEPEETKKKPERPDQTRVVLQPTTNVRMKQFDDLDKVELVDLNACNGLQVRTKDSHLKYVLDKLLGPDPDMSDMLPRLSKSHSLRPSASLIVSPKQYLTPPVSAEKPVKEVLDFPPDDVERAIPVTTNLENEFLTSSLLLKQPRGKSHLPGLESISELAESVQQKNRLEEGVLAFEMNTFDDKLHALAVSSEIPSLSVPQDDLGQPASFYSEKQRHQDIIRKLMEAQNGKITLEDAAQKPLRKLTVSRAFMDVLILAKSGYVTLTPEKNSLELKFIVKGPKLINTSLE